MWEEIIVLAIGNGLWAVLSCLLLAYLLKDSKKREAKYTKVVGDLTEALKVVGLIQEGVRELGGKIDLLTATNMARATVAAVPVLARTGTS